VAQASQALLDQGFHKVEIPKFPHPSLTAASQRQTFGPPKAGEEDNLGYSQAASPPASIPNLFLLKTLL
jgi:hypothetical protein